MREVIFLLGPPDGFTVSIRDDMPLLKTAKTPLLQVFQNVIENAIKHHDRSRGRIEVSGQEDGEYVEFSVSDDGPGIAPEFHDRVFGMFQTLQPRDRVEGSGIGLAVVKRIVESYNGRVGIDSTPGRGTRLRFTWPRKLQPET